MAGQSRSLALVYNYTLERFKNINLDNVKEDVTVIPQVKSALKFISENIDGELPKLSLSVLKQIHLLLMDFVAVQLIYESDPDYIMQEPGPDDMSDNEYLAFIFARLSDS